MSNSKLQPGRTGHQQSRSNLHQSHGIAPPPIKFPSSSTSSVAQTPPHYTDNDFSDVESGEQNASSGERAPLFRTGHHDGEGRPGLPKLSRECLWSEFKCYGSYIFPVLLVFGVLAVGIALIVYYTVRR
ncbi:hypothetical protein FFLO_06912 [Filobasidium floriforme]|uniref:Uncharacterized protein n=1 Tax=Filobasidium floriforme TaxID=5210 RepID=A0A8K0NMK2_9TREE|nr:hypothetical protein FFLO_06912 [Filobasidium floriforme]